MAGKDVPAIPDATAVSDHAILGVDDAHEGIGGCGAVVVLRGERRNLVRDFGRVPKIVGIQKGHEFTPGYLDADVAGACDAPVCDGDDTHAAVPQRSFFCHRPGVVGRSIVYDDNLGIRICLPERRGHRSREEALRVECRDDDARKWLTHHDTPVLYSATSILNSGYLLGFVANRYIRPIPRVAVPQSVRQAELLLQMLKKHRTQCRMTAKCIPR